ncbi:uncharacterized protein AKAW2_51670A [Aspergillus luchuensis]|uniref:Uncharacterized protein n=1 Tax=Aspergillus kawachii TaxID=1069201 RepID=A0A7R8A050_ASPKA|nr:uncharacterized protein AKAW2_51670A [Aspergillus luchuensis]BCS01329.1 hypothetical protein AKAW2_51670A [Aspergillus luchuensis]
MRLKNSTTGLTTAGRWSPSPTGPTSKNGRISHDTNTQAEFDALLGDYDAVLDSVPAMFAAELIEAYPKANVRLNTRSDLDAWHRSFM